MSIPLIIALALPGLGFLLSTHAIFSKLYEEERQQIAVDNAAIILGREDRAIFNAIETSNAMAAVMDLAHDTIHICARTPSEIILFCKAADVAAEASLTAFHKSTYALAISAWRMAKIVALGEYNLLIPGFFHSNRIAVPPLREERCALCRQAFRWRITQPQLRYTLRISNANPTASVRLRPKSTALKEWNYSLESHLLQRALP